MHVYRTLLERLRLADHHREELIGLLEQVSSRSMYDSQFLYNIWKGIVNLFVIAQTVMDPSVSINAETRGPEQPRNI